VEKCSLKFVVCESGKKIVKQTEIRRTHNFNNVTAVKKQAVLISVTCLTYPIARGNSL